MSNKKYKSISRVLKSQGKSSEEFETMINKLSIEVKELKSFLIDINIKMKVFSSDCSTAIKELLEIDSVKEAKGTFGYYDIFVKVQSQNSSTLEEIITTKIRNIQNVTTTTTLSIIPEQSEQ